MITHPGPWSALVTLPMEPGAESIAAAVRLQNRLRDTDLDLAESVPAFNRLLLTGSPETWDPERVESLLTSLAHEVLSGDEAPPPPAPPVILPACYHESLAPDLTRIARNAGLSRAEAAQSHAEITYTVLATGFAPGFAYLGDVPESLAACRRESPRQAVPAGSIGIADRRTGVYPTTGPGGWQLVGAVPPALFADATERIRRFRPGQTVRFRVITLADYEAES